MATSIYSPRMTLREGDRLPSVELVGAGGTWRTDAHRERRVPMVLILHRHLA